MTKDKILNQGKVNPKLKNIAKLFLSNIVLILAVSFPLILHYLVNYFRIIQSDFNLSNFYTVRDIYLIVLSIYFGYLFLEIIKILRLPIIKWILVEDEMQILLKIIPTKDIFNRLLGTDTLDKLSNEIKFNTEYRGKWGNRPEPLTYTLNNNNEQVTLPDATKIPDNKFTYIKEGDTDYLVLSWKNKNKFYKVDEYNYHPSLRYSAELKVKMPDSLTITLDNNQNIYMIKINKTL